MQTGQTVVLHRDLDLRLHNFKFKLVTTLILGAINGGPRHLNGGDPLAVSPARPDDGRISPLEQ
jgi:hypothetical protein